eukprot:g6074.t1
MEGSAAARGGVNAQHLLKRENLRLQALVSELRSASPSVARLADLAVWKEREAFEEKQNRALALLRRKDAKIRELGEAAARRRNASRQRSAEDGKENTAATEAGVVHLGGGGGGGGGVGGRRAGDDNAATVVKRLEERAEEQADQIEALLQEVVRLRSTPGNASRPPATGEGENDARYTGTPSRADSTDEGEARRRQQQEERVGEWREAPAVAAESVVDDLRSQVARLEHALSSRADALACKDAALERASEEHRQREASLQQKVKTLERLQETARRTVLDREERLRGAEEAAKEFSTKPEAAAPTVGATAVAVAAQGAGSFDADATRRGLGPASSGNAGGGGGGGVGRGPALVEEDAEEHFGAQEWWLHLAAAEKRREEKDRRASSRESDDGNKAGVSSATRVGSRESAAVGGGSDGPGKESRRLHALLEEQGLEVVALRQRVLKAEIVARARDKDLDRARLAIDKLKRQRQAGERLGGDCGSGPVLRGSGAAGWGGEGITSTAAERRGVKSRFVDTASLGEMEGRMTALHAEGHAHEALAAAREAVSALKLALVRSEGEIELQAQLLEDEKERSVAALSRAENLQGRLDRVAVEETLRGVSGGAVSAAALINCFAGTLFRQSRRVKEMEEEVRNMRTRCARLARLARGDSADAGPPAGGGGGGGGGGTEEGASADECWVEAGVQEAAAAMEAGRRRALEEEVESLRNEVLAERRRADEAERDAKDERRLRSLAPAAAPAPAACGARTTTCDVNDNSEGDDAVALRRKLKLATSEIEALRTHVTDLRNQIQSGWWPWRRAASGTGTDGEGDELASGGVGVGGDGGAFEAGVVDGACGAKAVLLGQVGALAAAGVGVGGGSGGGGGGSGRDDGGASIEFDRLTSLLAERDAQIGVLTSTVEALQTSPVLVHPSSLSPRKSGTSAAASTAAGSRVDGRHNITRNGSVSSPRLRASSRGNSRQAATSTAVSPGLFWVDVSGDMMEADGGGCGGVGVLNHVGAQGLARRCVALTVRLTSAIAREGKAERRADQLAAEAARRERKTAAAAAAVVELERRNRALETGWKKTAVALNGLRAETAARLREAGEEASKLRSALRDAELGADDARQRLASARAEGHALAVELKASREKHREEVRRLLEAHDARVKEVADRFIVVDGGASVPPLAGADGGLVLGLRGARRGGPVAAATTAPTAAAAAALTSSPVAAAIAELAAQWRAFVWRETNVNEEGGGGDNGHRRESSRRGGHRTSSSSAAAATTTGQRFQEETALDARGNHTNRNIYKRGGGGAGGRGGQRTFISERQLLATTTFLQETAARLDSECSRAVRRARAAEWELSGARRARLDATAALEEAREEVCRLSARTAAAESALAAATENQYLGAHAGGGGHLSGSSCSVPDDSGATCGGQRNGASSCNFGGGGGGEACRGAAPGSYYTVAAVSLLEKRFAAAVEDLVALGAAAAAARVGEAAANARAEEAEARATGARADADVLAAELERHKAAAADGVATQAEEWRREIRAELGRWWQDDVLPLHNGVTLDWGSAGTADSTAALWQKQTTFSRQNGMTRAPTPSSATAAATPAATAGSATTDGSVFPAAGRTGRGGGSAGFLGDGGDDVDVNRGVSGEEAMAQALIAGRAEQAWLEDRLKVSEYRLEQSRREASRLRAVLERWHGDFVLPATKKRRRMPPDAPGAARVDGEGVLERKLLAATSGLLGAREESAALRRELLSLHALLARLREDEKDARETAGRRVESARETARRRAAGDLRDAAERLEEERERFKSQLGAAHAEILRLGAEAAELDRKLRRRNSKEQEERRSSPSLRLHQDSGTRADGGGGGGGGDSDGGGGGGKKHAVGWADYDARDRAAAVPGEGVRKRRVAERGIDEEGARVREEDGAGVATRDGETERDGERALRREVEAEREALRRMCNGLAVDLRAAVEGRAEAEDEREALVQEAAKAKAEAKMAGLARENLEASLKELGRLLEFAREEAGGVRDPSPGKDCDDPGSGGDRGGSLSAAALSSGRDRSKEEARRFARVMVAAKVAEADLLRRLQGASSREAELRHTLRRRDIRIEELKRDQAARDRLGRSFGGTSGSSGSGNQHHPVSLRESTSVGAGGIGSGIATEGGGGGGGGSGRAVAAERVALRAAMKQLELELAEATVRGEVGDAVTREAERLALRLFPEAAGGGGGGGGGVGDACCRVCGAVTGRGATRSDRFEFGEGRGALFLVPSADVEQRAATAEAVTVAASAASAVAAGAEGLDGITATAASTAAAAAGNGAPGSDNVGPGGAAMTTSLAQQPTTCTASSQTCANIAAGDLAGDHGHSSPSGAASLGFGSGIRSLEANLARLEAVASGRLGDLSAESSADGGFLRGRSASPAGRRLGPMAVQGAWAEAVRELRAQVAGLRRRAEATEELVEEARAGKDALDEEVLRLRTELLRQQRSYWQATAALKERYELALNDDGQGPSGKALRSLEAVTASSSAQDAKNGGEAADGAAEMAGSSSRKAGTNNQQQQPPSAAGSTPTPSRADESGVTAPGPTTNRLMSSQQSPLSSRLEEKPVKDWSAEGRLRDSEQELRDVRTLHAREARDVATELARVVEAHRARVATLEEKLRRARKKVKAMARPKTTRRGRELASDSGGGGGAGVADLGALFPRAPLSTDELLNLLAAADEQVFDAKGRVQQLEFELRSKNAELAAVFAFRDGGARGTVGNAVPTTGRRGSRTEEEREEGGSVAAGNGRADAVLAAWSGQIAQVAAAGGAAAAPDGGAAVTMTAAHAVGLGGVALAARLASAEAEVERLRDETLAARELAIGAQREASALRLAAQRRATDRAGEGRSREKELRRQVSAYKREAERLRSTAASVSAATAATAGVFSSAVGGKNGRVVRKREEAGGGGGGGGAGACVSNALAAKGEEDEEGLLRRRAQQLASAREESERRGRTIVALRAAKAALAEDLRRLKQEAADRGEKLARALKDLGVKSNTVKALREKIAALEAEKAAATAIAVGGHIRRDTATPPTDGGAAVAPGGDAPALGCDVQSATVRDLRTERDRLRANTRGLHAALSKKSAEISTQVAELERLEQEAASLRAAVARKDDAYRTTRKQLLTVRDEYEKFKDLSHRWRADAEAKWRGLKRASEASARKARTSEESGDAAERELAALKSAFRSFLKTLWDDLRSRPPHSAAPVSGGGGGADDAGVGARRDAGIGARKCEAGDSSPLFQVGGIAGAGRDHAGIPALHGSASTESKEGGGAAGVPSKAPGFGVSPMGSQGERRAGEEMFAGLGKATAAMTAAAAENVRVAATPPGAGGGGVGDSAFGDLTEAEVSDIMQALSAEDEGGCPSLPLSSFSSSSSSRPRHYPIALPPVPGELSATRSSSLEQHHQPQPAMPPGLAGAAESGGRATSRTPSAPLVVSDGGGLGGDETVVDDSIGEDEAKLHADRRMRFSDEGPPRRPPPPPAAAAAAAAPSGAAQGSSPEFEGKEAFADRVEAALGSSNTSAALADMLRSLRTSSFAKAVAEEVEGAASREEVGRTIPQAPRRGGSSLSRSWSQPGVTPASAAWRPLDSRSPGELDAVGRWPTLHNEASRAGGGVWLGGVGGGGSNSRVGGTMLSPLEEMASAESRAGTLAAGSSFGDGGGASDKLLVEHLAS